MSLEEPPRKSQRKSVQTLDAQAEKMRNYSVLQRNMIPVHKHAAEKGATSDPHNEMEPQKIGKILDGGWARRRDCGDETKS